MLSKAVVDTWTAADPTVTVNYRDLAADAYPHFAVGTVDDEAIEELIAADALVIGAPMYNLGVPTQLKAWIDRVCVAGRTFTPAPTGMVGLRPRSPAPTRRSPGCSPPPDQRPLLARLPGTRKNGRQ